jgi:flagellar motor switch protein FliG
MSDFKNGLDAYKKAAGKKTENSGFKADDPKVNSLKSIKTDNSDPGFGSGKGVSRSTLHGERIKKELPVTPEKFIFHQLDDKKAGSAPFIKETTPETKKEINKKYSPEGLRRVAKLLALLGKEEAANVLKSFSPDEIKLIAAELLKIKSIDRDEASELLKIIHKKNTKTEIFSGGVEKAREILVQAYGEEKGEEMLKKSLPEKREKPFEFLNDIEPLQIKLAARDESLTITSIILNYLAPDKSASLLEQYSPEQQKVLVLKMSKGGRISRDVVEKIEEGLKTRIREQGKVVTTEVDGKNRLAGILRFMDPEEEERILDELNDVNPELSKEIDSKIFNIDIVFDIPDKDFQKLLNDFSEEEIALILKGRNHKVKKKFLKNLSHQRKEIVQRESDFIGIVRKSEVNKATTEFLDYIRQFEKEGKIIVNRGGNLFV